MSYPYFDQINTNDIHEYLNLISGHATPTFYQKSNTNDFHEHLSLTSAYATPTF